MIAAEPEKPTLMVKKNGLLESLESTRLRVRAGMIGTCKLLIVGSLFAQELMPFYIGYTSLLTPREKTEFQQTSSLFLIRIPYYRFISCIHHLALGKVLHWHMRQVIHYFYYAFRGQALFNQQVDMYQPEKMKEQAKLKFWLLLGLLVPPFFSGFFLKTDDKQQMALVARILNRELPCKKWVNLCSAVSFYAACATLFFGMISNLRESSKLLAKRKVEGAA